MISRNCWQSLSFLESRDLWFMNFKHDKFRFALSARLFNFQAGLSRDFLLLRFPSTFGGRLELTIFKMLSKVARRSIYIANKKRESLLNFIFIVIFGCFDMD